MTRQPPLRQTARQWDALAALLDDIGGRVVACRDTAAALHGFDGYTLRPPFHVLVDRGRRVSRVGHVVHATAALDRVDLCELEGVLATTPTRTIIDLAPSVSSQYLRELLYSATASGDASVGFLHRRLVALRTRGRAGIPRVLEALAGVELDRGTESWLEREFLRLLRAHRLPEPQRQQVLGRRGRSIIRVDCRFAGTQLVVELLGYRFHRTVMQMQVDAERLTRMQLDGFVVVQFTYLDVVERPSAVIATVREALAAQSARDRTARRVLSLHRTA